MMTPVATVKWLVYFVKALLLWAFQPGTYRYEEDNRKMRLMRQVSILNFQFNMGFLLGSIVFVAPFRILIGVANMLMSILGMWFLHRAGGHLDARRLKQLEEQRKRVAALRP